MLASSSLLFYHLLVRNNSQLIFRYLAPFSYSRILKSTLLPAISPFTITFLKLKMAYLKFLMYMFSIYECDFKLNYSKVPTAKYLISPEEMQKPS